MAGIFSNGRLSEKGALIIAVFIAGLCSIVYELLVSTTSSYFLGDSIKQFSLTIGIYMAAMGLGSYLSKFLEEELLTWFIGIELLLGLLGGAAVPVLYGAFPHLSSGQYQALVLVLIGGIGVLTGFEIPLLARIMKAFYPLKSNLANVLSLDYIGALAATLLFPFILLPGFGLFRTSIIFGLVNIALGVFIYRFFSREASQVRRPLLWIIGVVIMVAFTVLLLFSRSLLQRWESKAYSHNIIHAEQTPYQNLVLTRNKADVRLYINRIIQFSTLDEYRYHEMLALLPAAHVPQVRKVLILGGGEGLLAREVLRLPTVDSVVVVDLDQRVFDLARNQPQLRKANKNALFDPRLRTVADDASLFLRYNTSYFDLILADLPDPSNEAVARLYSTYFFRMARRQLAPGGVFATQAGSPFHTREAYWCIVETLRKSGFRQVLPYHALVPSFGPWGFVMATDATLPLPALPQSVGPNFLELDRMDAYFHFPPDMSPMPVQPNTLDQPALLDYYLKGWRVWQGGGGI